MAKTTTVSKPNFFRRTYDYLKECYIELRYKVSWPTKKELANSAVVVLTASLIIAAFVFLVDKGFQTITSFIYGLL